jgi:TRAP-type transport system periplasmic protein
MRHFALLAGLATCLSTVGAAAQTKWDLPTAYPVGNFHSLNIQKFADAVKQSTGGKLLITVHPGASLFKAPEIKRAVQTGQAQIGEVLMVNLANENPIFEVDGIPFLATDYDQSRILADAQRPFVEKLLDSQGMKLLFTVPWPPQGVYANKEINSLKDMEGLKWRSYSAATQRIGELVKAQPVTVQAAELSQALATGVVNAMMTSGATGVDSKVWEQVKFYYDTQAWLPKNMVMVNKAAFDQLDKATQDAVVAAAKQAEAAGWADSRRVNTESLETLAKNGMKVQPPSATLKAELGNIGRIMTEEWTKKAGAEGGALIANYRK